MVEGQLRATSVYAASSANRVSHIADWAVARGTETLVYATHRSIATSTHLDSAHPPPTHLVPTPRGDLTVLKYSHPFSSTSDAHADPAILAGSSDGHIHLVVADDTLGWKLAKTWANDDSHSGSESGAAGVAGPATGVKAKVKSDASSSKNLAPIRALGVLRPTIGDHVDSGAGEAKYLFVSASSDGVVRLWSSLQSGDGLELLQTLSIGNIGSQARTEVLPLDIALVRMPGKGDQVLMAIAGTHSKIDLWLGSDKPSSFKPLFSLSGHTDWVRSLDFCTSSLTPSSRPTMMLASASQDGTVRLWRLQATDEGSEAIRPEVPRPDQDEFDRLASEIEGTQRQEDRDEANITTRAQTFFSGDSKRWQVKLDALLFGHEGWVTGLRWAPPDCARREQAAALLTSSADNSVILWAPSSSLSSSSSSFTSGHFPSFEEAELDTKATKDDIWVAAHRFGELGGTGSAANGMYGAAWKPQATSENPAVMAHGYGGAIHIWSKEKGGPVSDWQPRPAKGGHFASASSVRWEPRGDYLISGGLDKTTRLHGRFRERLPNPMLSTSKQHGSQRRDDENAKEQSSWHEIARPQTHGYEIVGLSWLSRLMFASAGGEKIVRVFEAPQGFVDSAVNLATVSSSFRSQGAEGEVVVAVYLPTLGHLRNPAHLARPVREATLHACCCDPPRRVSVLAISPVFSRRSGRGEGPPALSFEDAEAFLKWSYAQAWGVAVQRQRLQTDVDVLCVADEFAQACLDDKISGGISSVWLVDEPSSLPPASVLDTTKISRERVHGILPSSSPFPAPIHEDSASLPQHRNIAMGGTFDHLHAGHKILLSMAAMTATERIIAAVTDDSMLTKKKYAEILESLDERTRRVDAFLELFGRAYNPSGAVKRDVSKLTDVAGPAGTEEDLQAIILTDETVSGGDYIDKVRAEKGLKALSRLSIGVLGSGGETEVKGKDAAELAAAKVGSSYIREWLAKKGQTEKENAGKDEDDFDGSKRTRRPVGASVPPLGLSNRAVYDSGALLEDEPPSESGQAVGKSQRSISLELSKPPTEETLHLSSLWSEVEKVYGHSLELLSIDAADGLIATSANARTEEQAAVRIFDTTQRFKEVQVLTGHQLGATSVRFSLGNPAGRNLLTASRDRSWRLYERDSRDDQGEKYKLVQVEEEAHSRIIYDAAWALNGDMFATASRDRQVKIWQRETSPGNEKPFRLAETIKFSHAVTALAFGQGAKLAVGLESGDVVVLLPLDESGNSGWKEALRLAQHHTEVVNELAWQPLEAWELEPGKMLASAGADGTVRIVRIE